MGNKARLIRDMLKVSHFDAELSRQEIIERNPLTWLLEVDGLIVDARQLPRALQIYALELGLIPYVPGAEPSDG